VAATLETEPSPRRGDAIDDPAIWVSPSAAEESLILATDKRTGLYVYSMNGEIVQHLAVGRLNNVDVRGNVAVASLRDNNSLQFFDISQAGEVSMAQQVSTDLDEIYGLCMGYEEHTDRLSVYVNGKSGRIQQFWIKGADDVKKVREMSVPSQPEGCVVDDKTQRLFVGEEDVGIWLFDAAVNSAEQGELIIKATDVAEIVPDIEGLALAQYNSETLLFVSSQGSDSYVIFDAEAPYTLRHHFRIRTNVELGIDGASETDGLEVTTQSLGKGFEQGALVVQDGRNRMPEAGQNLKLVPLQTVLD
ncbi:MAG: phytase, partial [Pseudomonadota bacterium]|nr:phytase [Pseudomonadota bacterium]